MKKPAQIFFAFFIIFLANTTAIAAEYKIKMLNQGKEGKMVFEPSFLKVNIGDIVTFIPAGEEHDSISIFTPEGANTWHGRRNQRVSVTINKEGIYIYKCAPHFYVGMVGVIQAGKANNFSEAKLAAENISRQFITHKDRLINYLTKIQ